MISCYFGHGLLTGKEVISTCTINFRGSEQRVKSLFIVFIAMIDVAEEVSDKAETTVEISMSERVIRIRS